MKSRTRSLLGSLVIICCMSGALSGCSEPDNPPPAKPTETPPAPTAKDTQPHMSKDGKAYGSSDRYKNAMKKPGT
jgi:hypothetical protein